MKTAWFTCVGLFAIVVVASGENVFEPIFDGRSLADWETPDPSYWTVEDGAITGRITKEHPCTVNQYLVWKGGELADFELKIWSRLIGEGGINNGFQFRSRLLPDHDICGYQVDNNLETPWLVRLYDEYGRHTLAMRGERTVFLRARDPRGEWNAALLTKGSGRDRVSFSLSGADLPDTPGPDIGFGVRTDQGFAMASFPVSQIATRAWHDLAGRYDGHALTLFCDGRPLASTSHQGTLSKNNEPLIIGAETDGGKVVRQFHGELEEAALWSRALSNEEIRTLSHQP